MKLAGLFLTVCLGCITGHVIIDDSFHLIKRGIDELLQNNTKPDYLQNAVDNIFKIKSKSGRNEAICNTCVIITNALLKLRRNGASREKLLEITENLCVWFVINKRAHCAGYLELQIDTALYIVDRNPELTAEHICAIRLQEYGCTDSEYDSWSINIPPKILDDKTPRHSHSDEEIVVHLTDVHYDPLYEPGTNTECDCFICCQGANGKPTNPKDGAGYWGDYNYCDTPLHSIRDLLQQVVKQHPKIERVYYTGDIVSHQIWASSKKSNSDQIKTILNELKNTFKSIPVFPVLGNHESHPTDLYSPKNITDERLSSQWLLDLVAEEWTIWLPSDTKTTIKKGGYYTVLVKPGFRVIGLNSNLCYTYNLWLIYNNKDPHDQLQWLVDTLVEAEKNHEVVHIISHVPPGDRTCLRQWNHEYRRIINRFSNIISGQFSGHTHQDELKIFYSTEDPNKVVNVAFIGGSFTSFVANNPNYRVYNVDCSTWKVTDYEQWTYDLGKANQFPDQAPNWFKLYSFRNAYGLNTLDYSSYHDLLQKMASNSSLIKQYQRFRARDSSALLALPCETECLFDKFCRISSVEFESSIQCNANKKYFYKSLNSLG